MYIALSVNVYETGNLMKANRMILRAQ